MYFSNALKKWALEFIALLQRDNTKIWDTIYVSEARDTKPWPEREGDAGQRLRR